MCEADGFWTSSKGEKSLPVCEPGNGHIYKRDSQLTENGWQTIAESSWGGRTEAQQLAQAGVVLPKSTLITLSHRLGADCITHLIICDLLTRQA